MTEYLLLSKGYWLYVVLFGALIGGSLGLPIPEDLPLIGAGIAIQQNVANPYLTFIVCYVAIISGDMIIFFLGRSMGPQLFIRRWFRKRVPPKNIRKLKANLEKQGLLTVLLARHLFYIRTLTFLTCGAVKMRPLQFLVNDCIAALISVPVMMTIGFFASKHSDTILPAIKSIEGIVIVSVIAIAALVYFLKRKKLEVN